MPLCVDMLQVAVQFVLLVVVQVRLLVRHQVAALVTAGGYHGNVHLLMQRCFLAAVQRVLKCKIIENLQKNSHLLRVEFLSWNSQG